MQRRLPSAFSREGGAPRPADSLPGWRWPLRLLGRTPTGIDLVLRPLVLADAQAFHDVRRLNAAWLAPWDATSPDPFVPVRDFGDLVGQYDADARAGRSLPLVVEVDGMLVGQLSASGVSLGSFRSCSMGYWLSRAVAGQMVMPTALALVGDHLLGAVGLHRIEVNIRPENTASLAVVRKLGFRDEGLRQRMLHIDGEWCDHRSFALTTEDLDGEAFVSRLGRLARLSQSGGLDQRLGGGEPLTTTQELGRLDQSGRLDQTRGVSGAGGLSTHPSHESLQRHTGGGPSQSG
ncbi:MAG: GNAT family N-acetyltransferase [Dermatophilaceae bacterium]